MTIPSVGPRDSTPPARTPGPAAQAEPPAAAEPVDRVAFHIDPTAPHTRIIIPHGEPINTRPFSESKTARFVVAGSVVGGMSGGYLALGLMGSYPLAAAGVAVGSALVGAVAGYLATRK